MTIWAVSLLTMELSPHSLTPSVKIPVFGVCLDAVGINHLRPFSALPPEKIRKASPRAISRRTSYY